MKSRSRIIGLIALVVLSLDARADDNGKTEPLVIGETFTVRSESLGETRRINVYLPSAYTASPEVRLPVLYMPDGGMTEDFLHVAGLVKVLTGNGTMRPFLLVGIENTERRRDMTPPTDDPKDKEIAPRVGGAAAFRKFLRDELIPQVKKRYRTTDESAIVGESLAGLFIVDTFFVEPELFDTYIALDPSLWWNKSALVRNASARLHAWLAKHEKTLFLASSGDGIIEPISQMAGILAKDAPPEIHSRYEPMPDEKHSTIYHPAALIAFRMLLAPVAAH